MAAGERSIKIRVAADARGERKPAAGFLAPRRSDDGVKRLWATRSDFRVVPPPNIDSLRPLSPSNPPLVRSRSHRGVALHGSGARQQIQGRDEDRGSSRERTNTKSKRADAEGGGGRKVEETKPKGERRRRCRGRVQVSARSRELYPREATSGQRLVLKSSPRREKFLQTSKIKPETMFWLPRLCIPTLLARNYAHLGLSRNLMRGDRSIVIW